MNSSELAIRRISRFSASVIAFGVPAGASAITHQSPHLAALGPRRRLHLTRFNGVLAPNAGLRAAVVPGPAQKPDEHAKEHAHTSAGRPELFQAA
ncbi:MAG: hypothetical protein ACKVP9_06195 [Burkholderiales bacterium]